MPVHDWSIHPYDDDTGPATAFDVTPPPAPTMSSFAEAPAGDAAKGTRAIDETPRDIERSRDRAGCAGCVRGVGERLTTRALVRHRDRDHRR
jgi:hypothetical protein